MRALPAIAAAVALCACGGAAQTPVTSSVATARLPSPSASSESTPSPTPEPVAVLEPSVSFDLGQPLGLVFEEGDVMYAQVDSGVLRLDPRTGDYEYVVDGLEPPWGFGIGFGSAWASTDPPANGVIHRYDLATGDLVASTAVGRNPVESLAAFGSMWVPNDHSGTVSRIDPETNEVIATIHIVETPSGGPVHVAAGADRVWAASPKGNLLAGIDPSTNEVVLEITVPDTPCASTVSEEHLWIARCLDGPRMTWAYDPVTGDVVGELDATVVTNGERTYALAIEPGSGNTLVRAVDHADLTLSEPVGWPGIPAFVTFGTDMVWITSETQLLGYNVDSLPRP